MSSTVPTPAPRATGQNQNPTNPANPTPESNSLPASDLSKAQQQVAAALAKGRTITAAAAEVHKHRSTVYEWMKTVPGFREAIDNARAEYTAQLTDDMKDLSADALETVRSLLRDARMPPTVRLRAALAVLERGGWNLPADAEPGAVDRNAAKHAHRDLDREIKEQLLALGRDPAFGLAGISNRQSEAQLD